MRKLSAFALVGAAAVACAGAAVAGPPNTAATAQRHVMTVPLADGSMVRVDYAGEVAPTVTLAAPRPTDAESAWGITVPSLAGFDRMIAEMQRQSQEMVRRAHQMARQPAGSAPYIASFGDMPAGQTSTTVVSVSNNGQSCTRTTKVVSQGPGKPPKVTSSATGSCGATAPAGPINRT